MEKPPIFRSVLVKKKKKTRTFAQHNFNTQVNS